MSQAMFDPKTSNVNALLDCNARAIDATIMEPNRVQDMDAHQLRNNESITREEFKITQPQTFTMFPKHS